MQLASCEARRNQLMRDMAHLRLQDEVSRLEGSLTTTDHSQMTTTSSSTVLPPYVVADALTLCDHVTIMKQLATSSRFIIIIPVDGQSVSRSASLGIMHAVIQLSVSVSDALNSDTATSLHVIIAYKSVIIHPVYPVSMPRLYLLKGLGLGLGLAFPQFLICHYTTVGLLLS